MWYVSFPTTFSTGIFKINVFKTHLFYNKFPNTGHLCDRIYTKVKHVYFFICMRKSMHDSIDTFGDIQIRFSLFSISKDFKLFWVFSQFVNKINNNAMCPTHANNVCKSEHPALHVKSMTKRANQTLGGKLCCSINRNWKERAITFGEWKWWCFSINNAT